MARAKRFYEFPKPWYISLDALWQDDEKRFPSLKRFVTGPGSFCRTARDHVLIPPPCWHFTVLTIMRLNHYPTEFVNIREFARWVLNPIRINFNLVQALRDRFKPLVARLYEVRCFDSGTVLQFDCGENLRIYRDQAQALLRIPVSLVVRAHLNSQAGRRFKKDWGIPIVESMLDDPKKNFGQRAFGSIARSPSRDDASLERWHRDLLPYEWKELLIERIHLLVSDGMLMNERRADEDIQIGPTEVLSHQPSREFSSDGEERNTPTVEGPSH